MNISWGKEIIHQLIMHGVDYFCLSPGSRITPLALAIAEDPRARTFVHYDERGCAFHALGFAKATGRAAVILTTSGTAIGNIMPAVMEASLSRIPLILLTADRPPELRDTHANQTIDQIKLFSNFVRFAFDLPAADPQLPQRFLATTLAQAVFRAQNNPAGPVHINCMFREPFFVEEFPYMPEIPCYYQSTCTALPQQMVENWAEKLSEIEKGVIIVGSLHTKDSRESIVKLGKKLDWPILSDIDSGMRSYVNAAPIIPRYDLILKAISTLCPDAILHFGDQLVSKLLLEFASDAAISLYVHVAEHPYRTDPKHTVTHRIACNPCSFAEAIEPYISEKISWLNLWKEYADAADEHPEMKDNEISEPGIIQWLLQNITDEYALFFANGMPVRDANNFFYPKRPCGPIFTNRGVSGIDGNIGTIAGISEGADRPLIALIGDQTALHDINSLSQLKKTKYPIILFIINNHGSGIFSFLPVHENIPPPLFEEYFAAAHAIHFEHAAALFNLPYYHPKNWVELSDVPFTESCIIELTTDRARSFALRKHIQESYENCITARISRSP
ncbi:MAG: 2-succinyl-5-enolpyruvyl-6-hydroxy-3-cyclohexene-1-carboxylic-acid synthase [Chlamydiota bacterium]